MPRGLTTIEEDVTIEEIEQLFERMVVPRFDVIDKQLDYLTKRVDCRRQLRDLSVE